MGALLPNCPFEVVGLCIDEVFPYIIGLREVKGKQQGAAIVVGAVGQGQFRQSVRRRLVVDVVNRRHADLSQFGQVDVALQVVNRHGHEEFHIRTNQIGRACGEVRVVLHVECR